MFERIRAYFSSGVTWSSERAFVLATIAAAVGLGNIWRFPYLAGENGGASFVLAYIIAVILLGMPLMLVELGAGRLWRGGPVRTFRHIVPFGAVVGWLVIALTLIIMSYYLVVTGWTFAYAISSLGGSFKPFNVFLSGYDSLIFFVFVAILTGVAVSVGVRFIEVLSTLLMPFLIFIFIALTIYSVTQPGAGQAFRFLFSPEFSNFLNPSLWFVAFGQAFYSLAVGQGYLITYGSFLPERINLPRSVGAVALIETSFAILAGIMIFPIVFTFGMDPAQGTELAFQTLPRAFELIPLGSVVAVFFFVLFFLAAFSSCVAGVEVAKTAFKEEFNLSSGKATVTAFLIILPLGALAALSFSPLELSLFDRPFLEVLDLFAANQIVVGSGLLGGALISWFVPRNDLTSSFGAPWRRVAWWTITVARYLPIVVVLIVLITFVF